MHDQRQLYRLRWHPALRELQLWIKPEAFQKYGLPPKPIYERTTELLQALKAEGKIDRYDLHRTRLTRVWEVGARRPPTHAIAIALVSGAPGIGDAMLVEPPGIGSGDAVCLLSFRGDPLKLARLRPEWLLQHVRAEMARQDLPGEPHFADVFALWVRATAHREPVQRARVALKPLRERREGRTFHAELRSDSFCVDLVLDAAPKLDTRAAYEEVRPMLERSLARLGDLDGASGFCRLFERNVYRALRDAARGPQSLGLELPLYVAGGIAMRDLRDAAGKGLPTRLSTIVSAVLVRERAASTGPWRPAGSFAFYEDEHRRDQERFVATGIAEPRGTSGDLGFRHGIRLASSAGHSRWSRRVQGEAMLVARTAIGGTSERLRDVQAVTIGINELRTGRLKDLVRKMRARTLEKARAQRDPDAVYHFASELFPLTRGPSSQPGAGGSKTFDHGAFVMLIVRELMGLPAVEQTPEALHELLLPKISRKTVSTAMTTLVKNGFVKLDPVSGRYGLTAANLLTEQDGGGASLARFHEDMLDLTADMLEHLEPERSDVHGAVVAIRRETLPAFREIFLETFQQIVAAVDECRDGDQLYQLNVRLVPLTWRGRAP